MKGMKPETRKMIKDYLTICLMILYLITSVIGFFCPSAKESKQEIKDAIELLGDVP